MNGQGLVRYSFIQSIQKSQVTVKRALGGGFLDRAALGVLPSPHNGQRHLASNTKPNEKGSSRTSQRAWCMLLLTVDDARLPPEEGIATYDIRVEGYAWEEILLPSNHELLKDVRNSETTCESLQQESWP